MRFFIVLSIIISIILCIVWHLRNYHASEGLAIWGTIRVILRRIFKTATTDSVFSLFLRLLRRSRISWLTTSPIYFLEIFSDAFWIIYLLAQPLLHNLILDDCLSELAICFIIVFFDLAKLYFEHWFLLCVEVDLLVQVFDLLLQLTYLILAPLNFNFRKFLFVIFTDNLLTVFLRYFYNLLSSLFRLA